MTDRPFSIEQSLRYGWNTTMAHLRPLITLAAIGAVLGMMHGADNQIRRSTFLSSLGSLLLTVAQLFLSMVWIRTALRLRAGLPPDLTHWQAVLPRFWAYLLTSLLFGLVVGAGTIVFIVPGVIFALMFGFSGVVVMDKGLDPLDAFRESKRLTDGVKPQLLLFALAILGINLLGALALGIGLLVTVPTSVLASVDIYQHLRARTGESIGPWESIHIPGPPAEVPS